MKYVEALLGKKNPFFLLNRAQEITLSVGMIEQP